MSNDIGKISVRQAMILFIIVFCAPAIRYIPLYSSGQAKQAAWLAPFIALILQIVYMLVWCQFIKKYNSKSFVDITKSILGKIIGSIICIIYFIWITLFLSFFVRMYVERILSSTLPTVSIYILIGTMLLVVGYVLKDGIITIAKMAELFFWGLSGIFILYILLITPQMQIDNIFPITYKDALPIFKATFPIISTFGYNIMIFMFNDKIDHKGEFKKLSIIGVWIISLISLAVIIVPIGVLGWSMIARMPIPFLNTMKEISIFDIIERVELGIIMFWVVTDFMLICVFTYAAINMIKLSFNISNIKPLLTIYIVGIFFLSLILAKSTAELKAFSENILTPVNIALGFCLPILIFFIGKLRKKV